MLGNVSELCFDPGNQRYFDALPANGVATDPLGQTPPGSRPLRVARGGSWMSGPLAARVSVRVLVRQSVSGCIGGFRPALSRH